MTIAERATYACCHDKFEWFDDSIAVCRGCWISKKTWYRHGVPTAGFAPVGYLDAAPVYAGQVRFIETPLCVEVVIRRPVAMQTILGGMRIEPLVWHRRPRMKRRAARRVAGYTRSGARR